MKAADIGADAVGGSELIGVTKLLFGQCTLTSAEASLSVSPGSLNGVNCSISGVDGDDSAIATLGSANSCFDAAQAVPSSGQAKV
ncbi:MAG: hypothetical protein ACRD5H_12035, partial [Nitrososphaerales archaeon]